MIVVIGDIDTGVDYTAPQLYQQIWINQGEIPKGLSIKDVDGDLVVTFKDLNSGENAFVVTDLNKNGYIDGGDLISDPRWKNEIDEDGNGKADDLIGWNFVTNTNDPRDMDGHGSGVASAISSSVGSSVYIMPLQLIRGRANAPSMAVCVTYFTGMSQLAKRRAGAEKFVAINSPIVSNGPTDWEGSMAALSEAARNDILFVAAAGNDRELNNDLYPRFPANFSSYQGAPFDNVISVTALDKTGALSGDYGPYAVDVAADGGATSLSVSYVSAAIATYASANPGATAPQIKQRLLSTAMIDPPTVGRTVTGGKFDQGRFLDPTTALRPLSVGGAFFGTDGSDTIIAGEKDDLLIGHLNLPSRKPETAEIDRLTGDGGADLFVLGNYDLAFYAIGGDADYAVITDFQSGDKIGLRGALADYELRDNTSVGQDAGLGIYLKRGSELIAIVEGRVAAQMRPDDFETTSNDH